MSFAKNMKMIAAGLVMVGMSSLAFGAASAQQPSELVLVEMLDQEKYATDEMSTSDWSKAEAALLNSGVAKEDEVFAKLNLAFVYSSTGRRDMALVIYNDILASKQNPYALTVSGQPRRVKTIAKLALARLNTAK